MEHPSNILYMSVTFDVSKLSKLISSREEHPSNIELVVSTDDESKCDKSINFMRLQLSSSYPENKYFKVVIFSEKNISTTLFASIVNSFSRSTI